MSDKNQKTLQTYEKHAQDYLDSLPAQQYTEVLQWIDDNVKHLSQEAHILEVGSGSGRDADHIESQGFRVERTDAAQAFIDFQAKLGKEVRKLNVLTDEIEHGYDMIFADAVLVHFAREDVVRIIVKLYNALEPNGRLVFNLKRGDGDEMTDRVVHGLRYFSYWHPDEIEALLFGIGFSAVNDRIVADCRGEDRPAWLYLSAVKGSEA